MYKAIVIDDEHMIVKGLTHLIDWSSLGYELRGTAFSGESALNLIDTIHPDVVISDIQLGDMTGLEVMEKAHKQLSNIVFIFISGYDDFGFCQAAIAQGAVDYILKPIDFEYLKSVLKKCLSILQNKKILQKADMILFDNNADTNDDEKLIQTVKTYIDTHYYENIDMKSISNQFFISQTYFSELFKKEFKINFKKYLTQIRIEKAKLYIIDNTYSISEIAIKVGFNGPGHFSQIFKKHTNYTPREFKRKFAKKGDTFVQ